MHELRGFFRSIWGLLVHDTPALIVGVFHWILGDTWFQFGIRFSIVCFAFFIIRSLWARLADIGDSNPLATIGAFALIAVLVLAGLGAYYAGLWREVAPTWIH